MQSEKFVVLTEYIESECDISAVSFCSKAILSQTFSSQNLIFQKKFFFKT